MMDGKLLLYEFFFIKSTFGLFRLASGSVDNSVIVWNAHKFPERVAVLKTHTGLVKVKSEILSMLI